MLTLANTGFAISLAHTQIEDRLRAGKAQRLARQFRRGRVRTAQSR